MTYNYYFFTGALYGARSFYLRASIFFYFSVFTSSFCYYPLGSSF